MDNICSSSSGDSLSMLGAGASPEKESLLASIFCFMDKESIGNFSDSYFVSNLCHHQVYSELPADCDELSRDIVPVNLFYSKSKEDLYRHLGYLSANDLVSFNDFITNTSGCNNKSGINKDDSVDAMFNSGYEIFCCDNYKQFGNCKELESLIQLKVFLDDVISERNSYFSSNFPSRIDPSSIGDTDWSECTQSRVWSDYFESKWLPIPKWNAHPMYQVVHGDGSNDLIGSYNRGKHFVFSLPEPCYLGKGNVVVRQPVMPEFNFDSDYRLSFLNSTREFYNCDPLCFLNEDYILHRGDVCCPHTYNYGGMCKNLLLKMVGETLCSAAKIIVLLNKSEFLLEASSKGGYLRKSFYHLAKVYLLYIRYVYTFLWQSMNELSVDRANVESIISASSATGKSEYYDKEERIDRRDKDNIVSLRAIGYIRRFISSIGLLESNLLPVMELRNFLSLEDVMKVFEAKFINSMSMIANCVSPEYEKEISSISLILGKKLLDLVTDKGLKMFDLIKDIKESGEHGVSGLQLIFVQRASELLIKLDGNMDVDFPDSIDRSESGEMSQME